MKGRSMGIVHHRERERASEQVFPHDAHQSLDLGREITVSYIHSVSVKILASNLLNCDFAILLAVKQPAQAHL